MDHKHNVYFHLPGLFEFYDLYSVFLPIFYEHREFFYEGFEIGSIYGAPEDCLWGGGREGVGDTDPRRVIGLLYKYGISARLTFSNSLLTEEHLSDRKCNMLCALFEKTEGMPDVSGTEHDAGRTADRTRNGVIVHSELLTRYLRENYPGLYLVSSTTKVLTDFTDLVSELDRDEFMYVVPDFRLNKSFDRLKTLTDVQKSKVEFLCNECCRFECHDRRACYEDVSRKNLGLAGEDHRCTASGGTEGYRFSKAMTNPGFIGIGDIRDVYLPMGFDNFKIEGRTLGSAIVLEFLLYYLTKPEHQLKVREMIYLDSMLDLF